MGYTLYELAKQQAQQAPPASTSIKKMTNKLVCNYLHERKYKYYMFLNKENNYYTIFTNTDNEWDVEKFGTALQECIDSIGIFIDCFRGADDQALEFWIRDKNSTSEYILFPYDEGVIEI